MTPKEFATEFMDILNEMYETFQYVEDIPTELVCNVFDTSERLCKMIIKGE